MRTSVSRLLGLEVLEKRQMLHGGSGVAVGNFTLTDVNPTSPTYTQAVSLSQYSGTTALYFIHST